jgi:hypothetical protein
MKKEVSLPLLTVWLSEVYPGFEILTTVAMKNSVLLNITACSRVEVTSMLVSFLPCTSLLKIEAVFSYEISLHINRATERYRPEV